MTADGSAGNGRGGFERWVASLQRPSDDAASKSDPDLTSALVDGSATRVQQIPKELIHRLRERETQGLLGVEVERTAIFKPPAELLARAKRMQPPSKPSSPTAPPPADQANVPTKPPPPEAAVPTVRPPPPAKTSPLDDDWAELETGLDALKPLTPRSVPAQHASRPIAPVFSSVAPRLSASAAPQRAPASSPPATSAAPPRAQASNAPATSTAPQRAQASNAPATSAAPASSRGPASSGAPASSAPASSSTPASRPGPAVVVGRTVSVVKSAEVSPPPASPRRPSSSPHATEDADALDEPTILRAGGFSALLSAPSFAPSSAPSLAASSAPSLAASSSSSSSLSPAAPPTELEVERTAPRVSGVVSNEDAAAHDSLTPEGIERGDSARRWVVIAAVFMSLVVLALAALKR